MKKMFKTVALAGLLTIPFLGASCAPFRPESRPKLADPSDGNKPDPKPNPNKPVCAESFATAITVQPDPTKGEALIRYEFAPGEIRAACNKAMSKAESALNEIASRSVQTDCVSSVALLKFENALADFTDVTTQLTFMAYVSTDEKLREEAAGCEEDVGKFGVSVFTRKDLYDVLKTVVPQSKAQERLLSETLKSFEKNGLKLEDKKLAEVRELKKQLTELESNFSANLNNDTTKVLLTEQELEGVSAAFLAKLKKDESGKLIVTTKTPDYVHVTENAKNPETRKKMLMAYLNRASDKNPKLLEQAIMLRQQIASLMGFKNWVDYRAEGRMASSAAIIAAFSTGLKGKLAERNKADLQKLLDYKKTIDPTATKVEAWDINYLAYQLKKRDYTLDDEVIREYFPADYVVKGMFEVYSTILGVEYKEVENAKVWHPSVKLFAVYDKKTGALISHFFADMFPREGKYGHAAAFTLGMGRDMGGEYAKPISSIVSNFAEPTADRPSLLNIDEVETLFHEFGHIMHQVLTKAPYASLAGTSVAQDFVEAPSQMLENWVWDPAILNKISGHYNDTSKKLPADLLQKILAAKDFNQGYFYTRQLFLGIMDFTMHSVNVAVDTTKLHDELYKQIIGVDPLAGNHFNGTFGHLMGGYDAGYYGYLWSEVYAQDMFTIFNKNGLLDSKTGERYRKIILEQGNMKEPLELVKEFLQRTPSNTAFYEKLGIKP